MNRDMVKKEAFLEKPEGLHVSFETRAIPGIIFREFFEKYGRGDVENISVGGRPYEMIDIVVEEDVCAGYMGLSENGEKMELVVWAWKPENGCDMCNGDEPTRNLVVMCGPSAFGGWDEYNGQRYENYAFLQFPVGGYEAGGLASMLAAMVHLRVCELLKDPHYEKTETFFRK